MLLERCPWYFAGPLLGLLLVGFRAALNRPFGALGGFIELIRPEDGRQRLGVRAFVLLGTILGGALFALVAGTLRPTMTYAIASASRAAGL